MGNVFAALYAMYRAKQESGLCYLRWEDLDALRVVHGAQDQIAESLTYLGFCFDPDPRSAGHLQQSEHLKRYESVLEQLIERGYVYACQCSRKDIRAHTLRASPDSEPVYAGVCREKELAFDDPSHPVALRFKAPDEPIHVHDRWAQHYVQNVQSEVGDFVIKRKDGVFAYQFTVVIDDIYQGITEVVRGRDLLSSTPRQIALYHALEEEAPAYAHGPLIVDDEGEKRSKRKGDETLEAMLKSGLSPYEICGQMGTVMGVNANRRTMSLEALMTALSDAHFSVPSLQWPPR